MTKFVCPACKTPLSEFRCAGCGRTYLSGGGIPNFLTAAPTAVVSIPDVYDEIYTHHVNVWEDQGRSEHFRAYFARLIQPWATQSDLLEIGCGEGYLLAELPGEARFGIDPSTQAIGRARTNSGAECAVAQAEALPFADDSFGVVVSVGVIEHFADPDLATREVLRVLRPGGRYVALIHVDVTRWARLRQKVSEYLWPRPRPLALLRWLKKKVYHPIRQPLRRSYTIKTGADGLTRNGFLIERVITRTTEPGAPLAGDHVVIYVARKSS